VADEFKWQVAMLAGHEKRLAGTDPEQESGRAKIAVIDPHVPRLHRLQHLRQQRSFLGVRVLVRENVNHQLPPWVQNHQRVARQRGCIHGTQHLQPPLGSSHMVAVQNQHIVSRQRIVQRPARFFKNAFHARSRLPHQGLRDAGFDPLKLVVSRLGRDDDLGKLRLIGRMDGPMDARGDQAHDFDERGKQQHAVRLLMVVLAIKYFQSFRRKNILQQCPDHHADRCLPLELIDQLLHHHCVTSGRS
jgi:hypothetical protein